MNYSIASVNQSSADFWSSLSCGESRLKLRELASALLCWSVLAQSAGAQPPSSASARLYESTVVAAFHAVDWNAASAAGSPGRHILRIAFVTNVNFGAVPLLHNRTGVQEATKLAVPADSLCGRKHGACVEMISRRDSSSEYGRDTMYVFASVLNYADIGSKSIGVYFEPRMSDGITLRNIKVVLKRLGTRWKVRHVYSSTPG